LKINSNDFGIPKVTASKLEAFCKIDDDDETTPQPNIDSDVGALRIEPTTATSPSSIKEIVAQQSTDAPNQLFKNLTNTNSDENQRRFSSLCRRQNIKIPETQEEKIELLRRNQTEMLVLLHRLNRV
jgi:hypothetical protein